MAVHTRGVVPEDHTALFDPFLWTVRDNNGKMIENTGIDQKAPLPGERRGR